MLIVARSVSTVDASSDNTALAEELGHMNTMFDAATARSGELQDKVVGLDEMAPDAIALESIAGEQVTQQLDKTKQCTVEETSALAALNMTIQTESAARAKLEQSMTKLQKKLATVRVEKADMESEVKALQKQIVKLSGHTNTKQKIQHLEKVKRELAEVKAAKTNLERELEKKNRSDLLADENATARASAMESPAKTMPAKTPGTNKRRARRALGDLPMNSPAPAPVDEVCQSLDLDAELDEAGPRKYNLRDSVRGDSMGMGRLDDVDETPSKRIRRSQRVAESPMR